MFIYTGFVAAIALASQPIGGAGEANFDNPDRPLVSDAPLGRSDI